MTNLLLLTGILANLYGLIEHDLVYGLLGLFAVIAADVMDSVPEPGDARTHPRNPREGI